MQFFAETLHKSLPILEQKEKRLGDIKWLEQTHVVTQWWRQYQCISIFNTIILLVIQTASY